MKKVYDVIVAGAGPSGITASLSAARNGMKVLLIDKNAYPGGMNTAAMVSPLMTFHAGDKQVIKGIAQEIIDRLMQKNATLGHLPDPIGVVSTITPVDTEMLRLVYFEMLDEQQNINLLLHTFIDSAETENGRIKSINAVNKSGRSVFTGKVFIDATGDADLAAISKVECNSGRPRDGLSQPMTLMFTLGGVNTDKVIDYINKNPEQFILNQQCDLKKYLAVSGFFDSVSQARDNGDLTLPRDRVLFFQGIRKNEVLVNMTRIIGLSGVNAADLSAAECAAHKQVTKLFSFFKKYIPGFEHCFLNRIASVAGVRESRRIEGIKTLTSDDVVHNACHSDSVAVCAFPIDIHDPAGKELNWVRKEKDCCYDVPYGVMVPVKIKNLLATGRCVSASHEALASVRISATAMALGQAAGTAAALCVRKDIDFADVDIQELQGKLFEQGAVPGKKWV